MSDLIVKDNALMNASYNLALVEQRLILLAILEARESGKGINANDPLTVHARAISISLKLRSTLHIKLSKMPARTYLHGSLVTNSEVPKGIPQT